jgi:hypothetical protein
MLEGECSNQYKVNTYHYNKTTFFQKNILTLSLGRFLWNLVEDTQNSLNFTCLFDKNFVCMVFVFWWFISTNVDFSDFILVKIFRKFDVRKQKLSLNHKKMKAI